MCIQWVWIPELAVEEMIPRVRNSGAVSTRWSKHDPETQPPDPWWVCPRGIYCGAPQLWLSQRGHRLDFVELEAVKEKPLKF